MEGARPGLRPGFPRKPFLSARFRPTLRRRGLKRQVPMASWRPPMRPRVGRRGRFHWPHQPWPAASRPLADRELPTSLREDWGARRRRACMGPCPDAHRAAAWDGTPRAAGPRDEARPHAQTLMGLNPVSGPPRAKGGPQGSQARGREPRAREGPIFARAGFPPEASPMAGMDATAGALASTKKARPRARRRPGREVQEGRQRGGPCSAGPSWAGCGRTVGRRR